MAEAQPQSSPQAAGAPDVAAVLRYACYLAFRSWAKFGPASLAVILLMPAAQLEWLLPLAIIAMFVLLITGIILVSRLLLLWQCYRVVRAYPVAEFRSPVEKVALHATEKRLMLRLGGGAESPEQRAVNFSGGARWPRDIENGVWFYGDDAFGGVAVVAATLELLFMQPRNWGSAERFRRAAGPERERRARRAGIHQPVRARW